MRDLVARREPLIDFALRHDAAAVRPGHRRGPGRGAARAPRRWSAKIKDRALRPEYVRKLAGDLGMEIEAVQRAVARPPAAAAAPAGAGARAAAGRPDAGRPAGRWWSGRR